MGPVRKRLLVDLADLHVKLDNYEAKCLGPKLGKDGSSADVSGSDASRSRSHSGSGGSRGSGGSGGSEWLYSLVLINDDNFNQKQIGTQVLVLLLDPNGQSTFLGIIASIFGFGTGEGDGDSAVSGAARALVGVIVVLGVGMLCSWTLFNLIMPSLQTQYVRAHMESNGAGAFDAEHAPLAPGERERDNGSMGGYSSALVISGSSRKGSRVEADAEC